MKKPFFLIILFLIPVTLIVILKFFGESHFSIPLFYQDERPTTSCDTPVSLPYSLAADIPGVESEDNHTIISFLDHDQDKTLFISELIRLKDKVIEDNTISFVLMVNDNKVRELNPSGELNIYGTEWNVRKLDRSTFYDWYKCKLFLPYTTEEGYEANTVLLDKEKRIRGYYDLYNREETDRLSAEVSILIREKALNK